MVMVMVVTMTMTMMMTMVCRGEEMDTGEKEESCGA